MYTICQKHTFSTLFRLQKTRFLIKITKIQNLPLFYPTKSTKIIKNLQKTSKNHVFRYLRKTQKTRKTPKTTKTSVFCCFSQNNPSTKTTFPPKNGHFSRFSRKSCFLPPRPSLQKAQKNTCFFPLLAWGFSKNHTF